MMPIVKLGMMVLMMKTKTKDEEQLITLCNSGSGGSGFVVEKRKQATFWSDRKKWSKTKIHVEEALPEWMDRYLCYKPLKKLLKNIPPTTDEQNQHQPPPPPPPLEASVDPLVVDPSGRGGPRAWPRRLQPNPK
ncbi:hypothetical protein LguiA_030111 [Lonicera macranthoides]